MQLVCGSAIVGELLVSNRGFNQLRQRLNYTDAHLPESFLTMLRRDKMTPYTSFASSSKGKPVGATEEDAGGAFVWRSALPWGSALSPTATTTPDVDESVFRGLLIVDPGTAGDASVLFAGAIT